MTDPEDTPSGDPVAQRAAQHALEATDQENKHPWVNRVLITFGSLLLILGTVSLVISAINNQRLTMQNKRISSQQQDLISQQHEQQKIIQCQETLIKNFLNEYKARVKITADDRKTIRDLVHNVAAAKTSEDVTNAFHIFDVESRRNDQRRAQFPIPSFTTNICNTTSTPKGPSPSAVPSVTPSESPHKSASSSPKQTVSISRTNKPRSTASK